MFIFAKRDDDGRGAEQANEACVGTRWVAGSRSSSKFNVELRILVNIGSMSQKQYCISLTPVHLTATLAA